jgi:phospholipid transport system transporter-binding protein
VRLPSILTLAEAGSAWQQLNIEAGALEGPVLHVDASALTDFDSAALALLLQARRIAQAKGMPFEVSGAPDKLVQLAQLYGVADLLGLHGATRSTQSTTAA